MKNISNISLSGKKVLIRVDFNVPLDENFNITDDSRIQAALPTIKKVIADGGKAIIMGVAGKDATKQFDALHSKRTKKKLTKQGKFAPQVGVLAAARL